MIQNRVRRFVLHQAQNLSGRKFKDPELKHKIPRVINFPNRFYQVKNSVNFSHSWTPRAPRSTSWGCTRWWNCRGFTLYLSGDTCISASTKDYKSFRTGSWKGFLLLPYSRPLSRLTISINQQIYQRTLHISLWLHSVKVFPPCRILQRLPAEIHETTGYHLYLMTLIMTKIHELPEQRAQKGQ